MPSNHENLECHVPADTIDDNKVRRVLQAVSETKPAGQTLEPSRGHPFPARMPLPLTKYLIRNLTKARGVVVDPMVGSGTTAIAAKLLGRVGIGIDRDPLAVIIARTATRTYRRRKLQKMAPELLDQARNLMAAGEVDVDAYVNQLAPGDQEFIRYWFPEESQQQLLALVRAVESAEALLAVREFAMMVISSLIIAKSAGASFALDIARSRPHKVSDKPISLPFDTWPRRFFTALSRHPFFEPGADLGLADIRAGDARSLQLEPSSADLVLTSPPYLNAIDYLRAHKFSLIWMGHDLVTLREMRGTMIGTERGLTQMDGLPAEVENKLSAQRDERTRAQVRRYLSDLGKTTAQISRVLKPGALAVLVVGPTMINKTKSDADKLLATIGEQHGLRFVDAVVRRINPVRRSLPAPGAVGGTNPLAGRMRREILVALRKE